MAEPIWYVVVCGCSGRAEPFAYIDDERPIGGALTIKAAPGSKVAAKIIAAELPEIRPHLSESDRQKSVVSIWSEHDLSETFWADGDWHRTWTIRCPDGRGTCPRQAQVSQANLDDIGDQLATKLDKLASMSLPEPGQPLADTVNERQRHVIPFRVFCRMLA